MKKKKVHSLEQDLKLPTQTNKHSKIMGIDFDSKNDMELKPQADGDVKVRYKNGKMTFDEYIDEMETRVNNHSDGKPIVSNSIGYFSGFGKGTLNKTNN